MANEGDFNCCTKGASLIEFIPEAALRMGPKVISESSEGSKPGWALTEEFLTSPVCNGLISLLLLSKTNMTSDVSLSSSSGTFGFVAM
ncbi:hypothetical protein ILYODFUR_023931 [Ilyodon furcidens]|uniref:Uncharacterized protein n=1 Tax=Ilyodon furcidens TaxID=33524 RepID=A0ABV0UMP4_9TELE